MQRSVLKPLQIVISLFIMLIISLVGFWGFRAMFFTFVDNYQFGYVYDYWNGSQYPVNHNGYVFSPFYLRKVHTIDQRPMQVCISTIQRVLNCKLVHFDPMAKDPETGLSGWELFIKWHGRDDYEGPGTSMYAPTNNTLFQAILTNYAYDGTGKPYAFLVIEKELKGDTVVVSQTTGVSQLPETKK